MTHSLFNKKHLNIGIVQPELYYPRGAERQVCELASNLSKNGHTVKIYTFELDKDYPFLDILEGVDIVSLGKKFRPLAEGNSSFFSRIMFFVRLQIQGFYYTYLLAKRIDSRTDFINAHNYPAQWISFFVKTPVIWTCNEPPYWHYYPQSLFRNIFFFPFAMVDYLFSIRVKAILCLDSRMKKIINKAYKKPIKIIGSGAELITSISQKKHKNFNLLFVGELHEQKRPADILNAAKIVQLDIPNVHVNLVGAGYLENELRNLAKKLNISVTFHGRVSNKELYSLFRVTDIGVFVPEIQPWGIFPLEIILAKVPLIISDECGAIDVLPKQKLNIVKTGDVLSLGATIKSVYKSYDSELSKAEKLANEIRASVSWKGYSEKFLDLSRYLLSKKN